MTGHTEIAPAREPGIGGPVDLAGIRRYQRWRVVGVLLLAISATVSAAVSFKIGLDWKGASTSSFYLPASVLTMHAYCAALVVLMAAEAGNVTESWLAFLGALWAVVVAVVVVIGVSAILALLASEWPVWLRLFASLLAGYAVILPPALAAAWLAHRRRKRLEAVEGGDA